MPFVNVYYPEYKLEDHELKEISKKIHHSLIKHFQVPQNDYFQLFSPYRSNHFFYDLQYLLEAEQKRSKNIIYISITCGPGRTINQKKSLYRSIAHDLHEHFNISINDIFITLNETPVENWSFGQGLAQMVNPMEEK